MSFAVCASYSIGTVCSKLWAVVFILSTDRIGADCCTGAGTYVWCAYVRLATPAKHASLRACGTSYSLSPSTQVASAAECGALTLQISATELRCSCIQALVIVDHPRLCMPRMSVER